MDGPSDDTPRTLAYATPPAPDAVRRARQRAVLRAFDVIAALVWTGLAGVAVVMTVVFASVGTNDGSYAAMVSGTGALCFAVAGAKRWRGIALEK